MLKSSTFLYKNLHRSALNLSLTRSYNFQTELYAKKFETKDEKLESELRNVQQNRAQQSQLLNYINAYHQYGFKAARLDPLGLNNLNGEAQLEPSIFGLEKSQSFPTEGLVFGNQKNMSVEEIESYLKSVYSTNMAIEFSFIQSEEEKLWIAQEFESISSKQVDAKDRVDILKLLMKSQVFDHFLASKFPTFKRYSLEGGESSMAFYHSVFSNLAKSNITDLVMGIAHRGRLNLMIAMLNLDPVTFFAKIKGKSEYHPDVTASGDIAHHFRKRKSI